MHELSSSNLRSWFHEHCPNLPVFVNRRVTVLLLVWNEGLENERSWRLHIGCLAGRQGLRHVYLESWCRANRGGYSNCLNLSPIRTLDELRKMLDMLGVEQKGRTSNE